MKYYVVAGEASGDLHGANLVHNIFLKDPEAQVRAWGGERLEKEGATIVKYLDEMSFMGFIEVFLSLPKILGLLKSQSILSRSKITIKKLKNQWIY